MGLGGADLLIAAGTLDAKIPLLASNRLLDALGMVLDMPNSSVTFTSLCVTVPLLRVRGHLVVNIVQFSECSQGSHSWRALQDSVDWNDPPPELVVQGDLGAALSPAPLAAHAWPHGPVGDSTAMVAQVAAVREGPPRLQEELLRDPHHGRSPRHDPGHRLRGGPTRAGHAVRTSGRDVPTPGLCPVRKRVREVRPAASSA